MKITVGLDLLKNYQRMPYELHYAIVRLQAKITMQKLFTMQSWVYET